MIRLVSVASITLPIFLLVAGSSISLAEGQTVGKLLMDALHAGEGVVRQIEDGGITVINDIETAEEDEDDTGDDDTGEEDEPEEGE